MTAIDLFIALDTATAGRLVARFVEPERPAGPSLLERIAARLRPAASPATAATRG